MAKNMNKFLLGLYNNPSINRHMSLILFVLKEGENKSEDVTTAGSRQPWHNFYKHMQAKT